MEPLLDLGKKHLVQLYHSEIYSETEGEILAGFPVVSSEIRVLVSTIAFGMGVSIPDIRKVVHWGASKTILSYWQEVGRCKLFGTQHEETVNMYDLFILIDPFKPHLLIDLS